MRFRRCGLSSSSQSHHGGHRRLDCVVDVGNEEELEQALERVDPEIFLLSPRRREGDTPLECVLDLLPSVPAGKVAR